MVWPGYRNLSSQAKSLWDNNQDAELKQYILEHIQSVASETKGFVNEWDVINEPYDNHDLMDRFGDSIMLDWYDEARSILPDTPLFINDYAILASGSQTNTAHQQCLYDIVTYLLNNHAPLSGIGMQSHFGDGSSLTPPEKLIEILNRFSKFNLPIEITEFTLDFCNEQTEADYMRDFMTAVFSHPSTTGIVQWNFWPENGTPNRENLYRPDGSIKPKGQTYFDMVYNVWWTKAHGTTNTSGRFTAPQRAFKGRYDIEASYDNKSVILKNTSITTDKSGENRIILKLPE